MHYGFWYLTTLQAGPHSALQSHHLALYFFSLNRPLFVPFLNLHCFLQNALLNPVPLYYFVVLPVLYPNQVHGSLIIIHYSLILLADCLLKVLQFLSIFSLGLLDLIRVVLLY